MTDTRDTRGIATFIVRFLLFYVVALLVCSFPLLPGLTFFVVFWHDGRLHFHPGDGVHIAKASRSARCVEGRSDRGGHRLRWGCPMATRTVTGC